MGHTSKSLCHAPAPTDTPSLKDIMDKLHNLETMRQAWSQCQGCNLSAKRRSVVFGFGNPNAQIIVVGEAPGANEDREGIPFVGQAGDILNQFLTGVSIDPNLVDFAKKNEFPMVQIRKILSHYIYTTNVVACRPPENRDPATTEQEICRTRLHEIIYQVDPIIIISLGRIAAEALLGKKCSVTMNRGLVRDIEIPGRRGSVFYPLLIALHPAYLLRINDFTQRGGMSDKTYDDILRAHMVVDTYNHLHYGITPPTNRPKPIIGKENNE